MKKYGLLGQKLSHSYSAQIHSMLGDYRYSLFEICPCELSTFMNDADFDGINVTIPYKKAVIPYCDRLSETAQRLGSVNTIVKDKDQKLVGYNTDYFGFRYMVEKSGVEIQGKSAIVLGNGGAAPTVIAVLEDLGARDIKVISRSGEYNYENIHENYGAQIIVNTTPVGMYPNNGDSVISLEKFTKCEAVFDLIYNPEKTALIIEAQKLGIRCESGLSMLVAQAKQSAEFFHSDKIDDLCIDKICRALKLQMKNIVLVGMPGCGKSTVGRLLAEKLGKEFVDADEYLVAKLGKSISEIFEKEGNDAFREYETEVLKELGKRSGCVIATGGGCVTRYENYASLHQNSTIVCIERELSMLAIEGRPLSQANDILMLYEQRKDKYSSFADIFAANQNSPEECADEIVRMIYEDTCS